MNKGKIPDVVVLVVSQHVESHPPHRGNMRDDLRPGLRITNYKKRTVIAFDVDAGQVSTIGMFHGGQDYETILQDDSENGVQH